jgi:hypothetical protein
VVDQPSIHRGKGFPVYQNRDIRARLVQRRPRFDDTTISALSGASSPTTQPAALAHGVIE